MHISLNDDLALPLPFTLCIYVVRIHGCIEFALTKTQNNLYVLYFSVETR